MNDPHTHPDRFTTIIRDLLNAGLVTEEGLNASTGGRRSTCLAIEPDARVLVGIEVSTHALVGLAINLRAKVLHRMERPLTVKGNAAVANTLGAEDAVTRIGDEAMTYAALSIANLVNLLDLKLVVVGSPALRSGLMNVETLAARTAVHL